jgi:hypothetical protein
VGNSLQHPFDIDKSFRSKIWSFSHIVYAASPKDPQKLRKTIDIESRQETSGWKRGRVRLPISIESARLTCTANKLGAVFRTDDMIMLADITIMHTSTILHSIYIEVTTMILATPLYRLFPVFRGLRQQDTKWF